jgi:hypothetical protein
LFAKGLRERSIFLCEIGGLNALDNRVREASLKRVMVRDESEVSAVLAMKNAGKIFHTDLVYQAIRSVTTVAAIRIQDIRRGAVKRAICRRSAFYS